MRFTKCRKLGITLIPSHVISAASPFDNWQQFQEIKFTFWVFCPRSERKIKLRWHFIMWQSGYWREWQRDFTSIVVSSTSRTEMCRMIHKELLLLPTIEIEAVLHFPFSPEWMLCCCVYSDLFVQASESVFQIEYRGLCASKLLRDDAIEVAT